MSQAATIAVCLALSAPLAAAPFGQQPEPAGTPAPAPFVQAGGTGSGSGSGQGSSRPTVTTTSAAPQEHPPTPRPGQNIGPSLESLGMRGFSVALVVGEMSGTSTTDSLPAGARKAITDMRDFLPYKNYRMLDASWSLCCAGRAGGTSGRLRGLEEEEYQFSVWVTGVNNNKMSISFQLREVGHSPEEAIYHTATRADRERLVAEARNAVEAAEAESRALSAKYGASHPEMVRARQRVESARRRAEEAERGGEQARRTMTARSSRQMLESTFSMEVGETVVIGTSRLKGDKALIALLTAAPKTGASTR